jgi:hypothetical protein
MSLEKDFMEDFFSMRTSKVPELMDQLGHPPKMGKIDPVFWTDWEEEHAIVLRFHLSTIFKAAAIGFGLTAARIGVMAAIYGTTTAAGMAFKVADGTRKAIASLIDELEGRTLSRTDKALQRESKLKDRLGDFTPDILEQPQELPEPVRKDLERYQRDLEQSFRTEEGRDAYDRRHTPSEDRDVEALLSRIREQAREGMDPDELLRAEIIGEVQSRRAEGVVISATTDARTRGSEAAAQELGIRSAGDRWVTQGDDRVCPICEPLHNTTRVHWGLIYSEGPLPTENIPHFNCRCEIDHVLAGEQLPFDVEVV